MKLKTTKKISYSLLAVFVVLMMVMGITHSPNWGYAAMAVIGIDLVFILTFWRCPNCGKFLGPFYIKHCTNCAEKIST